MPPPPETVKNILKSILTATLVWYTASEMSWKFISTHPGIYWNILEFYFFIIVRTLFKSNMFFLCKFSFAWIIDMPHHRGHCKFQDECLGGNVLEKCCFSRKCSWILLSTCCMNPDCGITSYCTVVCQLMDMGFTREHCSDALRNSASLEQATDWLLTHPPSLPRPPAVPRVGHTL